MAAADRPLDRLQAESGVDLSGLKEIQENSASILVGLRRDCRSEIQLPNRAAIIVVGSLGRGEVTSGSDVDHLLVTLDDLPSGSDEERLCNRARCKVEEIIKRAGLRLPSDGGAFNEVVWVGALTRQVGGDAETNTLLTRRMLLLLESKPLLGDDAWQRALGQIRLGYLNLGGPVKSYRPPRFLLNDVIRYWRTMCVDFEGKMRGRQGDGWGIRNAKLRTVRKMLFAGGLLPLLECHRLPSHTIASFLEARFVLTPVERVAEAALAIGEADAGARALSAYQRFLILVDDADLRAKLEGLREEDRGSSELWTQVKEIGDEFQQGMLGVLFGHELADVVRDYVIF